jgi:hypothetical protein
VKLERRKQKLAGDFENLKCNFKNLILRNKTLPNPESVIVRIESIELVCHFFVEYSESMMAAS